MKSARVTLRVRLALTCQARQFLGSRGQVGVLVRPQLAEVDLWKFGDPSFVFFFADLDVRKLRVLRIERRQERHAANEVSLFPDPSGQIDYLVRFIGDGDAWIVISPVDLVVQPVIALFDRAAVLAGDGAVGRLDGEMDYAGVGVVAGLAILGVNRDAGVAQDFEDRAGRGDPDVALVVGRPAGVQT